MRLYRAYSSHNLSMGFINRGIEVENPLSFYMCEVINFMLMSVENRGSNTSTPVLLNVSNELRKRDKMRDLPSI